MIIPTGLAGESAGQVGQLTDLMTPIAADYVPVEGQALSAPESNREIIANLYPASNLNVLTFTLPSSQASRLGQRVFVRSMKEIGEVTFLSDSVVDNAVVMFSLGDSVVFIKSTANSWSRVL